MASNSGTQDWFYHAPTKKESREPVNYPAASQIPMIGGEIIPQDRDEGGMRRGWLKSSDSKYVRLAKMGGRKDLLRMRTPPPKADEAKSYPRVDWFDHMPQEKPDHQSPRKVYLPDYMVHEEYSPATHEDELAGVRKPPRRAPFSLQDKLTVFARDGDNVTDKTAKLLEETPYAKRFAKKNKRSDMAQLNKALSEKRESLAQKQKTKTFKQDTKDPVIFGKLLSMGYQHDWYNDREKYYDQQRKLDEQKPSYDRKDSLAAKQEMKTTEYREQINKKGNQIKNMHTPKRSDDDQVDINQGEEGSHEDDLSKTERFNRVTPKVDTHWSKTPPTKNTYLQQLAKVEV